MKTIRHSRRAAPDVVWGEQCFSTHGLVPCDRPMRHSSPWAEGLAASCRWLGTVSLAPVVASRTPAVPGAWRAGRRARVGNLDPGCVLSGGANGLGHVHGATWHGKCPHTSRHWWRAATLRNMLDAESWIAAVLAISPTNSVVVGGNGPGRDSTDSIERFEITRNKRGQGAAGMLRRSNR